MTDLVLKEVDGKKQLVFDNANDALLADISQLRPGQLVLSPRSGGDLLRFTQRPFSIARSRLLRALNADGVQNVRIEVIGKEVFVEGSYGNR